MSLVKLPRELLDRIWTYLDWDQHLSKVPVRPDLFSLSLTCREVRQSVIPLLFRNVALVLQWKGSALVEPGLYRLRRLRPELACHIRCVHVIMRSQYETETERPDLFIVPADIANWQDPALESWCHGQHEKTLTDQHRARVDSSVQQLFALCSGLEHVETTAMTAESMIRQIMSHTVIPRKSDINENDNQSGSFGPPTRRRQLRRHVDALATALLCFPPTVRELIFEAQSQGIEDHPTFMIGLRILCATLRLFSDRIEKLWINTTEAISGQTQVEIPATLNDKISTEVIGDLHSLRTLTLSNSADIQPQRGKWSIGLGTLDYDIFACWHSAAACLRTLHLCDMRVNIRYDGSHRDFLDFIAGFANLENLWMYRMACSSVAARRMGVSIDEQEEQSRWLRVLIALRNAHRQLNLRFSDLVQRIKNEDHVLPASGLHWLHSQAVPIGVEVDHYRAQRLITDFVSFVPLWEAEDSERGREAAQDKTRTLLVDAAMSSRSRWFPG